jgi:hypothetical protein
MQKFDQIWPLAVGWETHPVYHVTDAASIEFEVLRDPDSHGPCLVCGEPTDWHLLHTAQRICGVGCIEAVREGQRERAKFREQLQGYTNLALGKPEVSPQAVRRHPRPSAPVQRKPCGGCPSAKRSQLPK